VDAVGLELSRATAVVACLFMVLGVIYIAVVCVVVSGYSPSTCFRGMVTHFAACAFVLLTSVLLST